MLKDLLAFIQSRLKKFVGKAISLLLPPKNLIILESLPSLSDNTLGVYEKMLDSNLHYKYKIVWFIYKQEEREYPKVYNVSYVYIDSQLIIDKMRRFYLLSRAKCVISCNATFATNGEKQFNMYLNHGTPLKDTKKYISINQSCNYVINQSKAIEDIMVKCYKVEKKQLVYLGYPRNDYLFSKKPSKDIMFPDYKFAKIIMWMPTFRQHKVGGRVDSTKTFKFGIPILSSDDDLEKLNNFLNESNLLLIIKPHPSQDISYLLNQSMSNLHILYDDQLFQKGVYLYELLGQMDALITDFSSVYFDYLLLDKPIGLTIDDLDEYTDQVGLLYNYYDVMKGEYINSIQDLIIFLEMVRDDVDNKKIERDGIKRLFNEHVDAKSSQRVYDFIVEKAGI